MRAGLAIAIGLLTGSFADAKPDPAAAKAANTKGVGLARAKKYKEAIAAYKDAIAADPDLVLAHYNLACAAALGGDADLAEQQLAWVANAAAWDATAKSALAKAPKDKDLAGLLEQDIDAQRFLVPYAPIDVAKGRIAGFLEPADHAAKFAGPLAAAAGKHDDNCDPKDAKQGRMYYAPVTEGPLAKDKDQLVATLRDGVALLDASGKVVARSEPLGCTTPGASQDQLQGLAWMMGAQESISIAPLGDVGIYAALYTNGGKTDWSTTAVVFVQRGAQLVKVFEAPVASSDAKGAGKLEQTLLGELLYTAPGAKQPVVLRWNASAFAFAPIK